MFPSSSRLHLFHRFYLGYCLYIVQFLPNHSWTHSREGNKPLRYDLYLTHRVKVVFTFLVILQEEQMCAEIYVLFVVSKYVIMTHHMKIYLMPKATVKVVIFACVIFCTFINFWHFCLFLNLLFSAILHRPTHKINTFAHFKFCTSGSEVCEKHKI